jgi:hypothetical protein
MRHFLLGFLGFWAAYLVLCVVQFIQYWRSSEADQRKNGGRCGPG